MSENGQNVPEWEQRIADAESVVIRDRFGAISEKRRRELDGSCECPLTEAEARDEDEALARYLAKESVGKTADEASALWQMYHGPDPDDYEPPAMTPRRFAEPAACDPQSELEEEYVSWRRNMNVWRKTEETTAATSQMRQAKEVVDQDNAEKARQIANRTGA